MSKFVFDERFGDIPLTLHRLMKRNNVTPSDFYSFEYAGLTFDQMEDAIRQYSKDGNFSQWNWINGNNVTLFN